MPSSDKIRVAVLFGGRSAEHEVSLQSAMNVIRHLDTSRFEVVPIGIDKEGNWSLDKDILTKSLAYKAVPPLQHGNGAWFTSVWEGKLVEHQQIQALPHSSSLFDVIFPAVHGSLCEDGTLQGLLELAGLPYVGCGVLSSAIGMDKDVSKRLAMQANITVPPFITIKHDQWQKKAAHCIRHITDTLSYPVFVKPANAGSSIGISKVKAEGQLATAIDKALQFDTKVLVEKALDVIELEIAVLEALEADVDPIVSIVGEIRPTHEFYSYDAKYIDENGAELLIPAPVAEEVKEKARTIAKKLFFALECEGMARVDLFLCKEDQQIYFNEINTIPGFTQISMYPRLMNASGISYTDLLTHLIHLAIKRHRHKSQLLRSYVSLANSS